MTKHVATPLMCLHNIGRTLLLSAQREGATQQEGNNIDKDDMSANVFHLLSLSLIQVNKQT